MSANEQDTALSRTTKFEHIHLDRAKLKKKYQFHDYAKEENVIYNPTKGNYSNSLIYEITTTDGKKYIGSTTGTIEKRLEEHIKDKNSQLFERKGCVTFMVALCFGALPFP